ncbi:hypothetical protein [Vibrio ordalii]|uniref:Pesticidal crystal protein N-terminal domain-containing protein n=1 Tax=Vibrio ordalii FS-238 TaxID=617133 RepID=A0A853R291_9VIBR|nr:hypothetical protein [Vibrio ordalii]OEE36065.1 hypothetical protein A1QS_05505 [Vibrio ordalii FS-238]
MCSEEEMTSVTTELTSSPQEPILTLPDNLDYEIDITPETTLNDRFRSATTGLLDLASKADKRIAVVSFIVKAMWPTSPNDDLWRQLTEQVQKVIDAAIAKEEFNEALAKQQTIYEQANKISGFITKNKKISPSTLNILIGWCQISMKDCHEFINVALRQKYSCHYLPITLSVANYHLSLLKYLYDVMELNREDLDFAPDSLLTYSEILGFLKKYETCFANKLAEWKTWRKSTFSRNKSGGDYHYYETKDKQPTGYDYRTLLHYRGLRLHRFRTASEGARVLNRADEASFNNGTCELLSSIAGVVYLTKYVPKLGIEDSKDAELAEKAKNLSDFLPLPEFSAHPQGPVFFAHYRSERKKPGWGEENKYYSDKERWVTKVSGHAKDKRLALIVQYKNGKHKTKTHTFDKGADLSNPKSVELTIDNPLHSVTVYIKDTFLSALEFEFKDGSSEVIGDTSSPDYHRKNYVPTNFVLHYIETSNEYFKSQDEKGVVFKNGLQAIKFRYADPNVVS